MRSIQHPTQEQLEALEGQDVTVFVLGKARPAYKGVLAFAGKTNGRRMFKEVPVESLWMTSKGTNAFTTSVVAKVVVQ